jgi:hypothetical protein
MEQSSTADKGAGECRVPSSEEKVVEKAFTVLPGLSQILRAKYGI